jgi:hypothetical protein
VCLRDLEEMVTCSKSCSERQLHRQSGLFEEGTCAHVRR